jgi:hypothetical protein
MTFSYFSLNNEILKCQSLGKVTEINKILLFFFPMNVLRKHVNAEILNVVAAVGGVHVNLSFICVTC